MRLPRPRRRTRRPACSQAANARREDVILPAPGGHPVKRVKYATEVVHDKTDEGQQEDSDVALPITQGRGPGLGREGRRGPGRSRSWVKRLPALRLAAEGYAMSQAEQSSSAAGSARVISFRRISRSSSWIQRLSCCICFGVARASRGAASACTALSLANTETHPRTRRSPGSMRYNAPRPAAVATTASRRAVTVQTRSRAGLDWASLSQR